MKQSINYLIVLLVFILLASCKVDIEKQTFNNWMNDSTVSFIIYDINIIDVTNGNILPNKTLFIKGDSIAKITGTYPLKGLSDTTNFINGTSKYIIPGLWDMHIHTSSESITREIVYPLFIANGITGIRALNADCFEPCYDFEMTIDQQIQIIEDINTGKLIGPARATFGSAAINSASSTEKSSVQRPYTKEQGMELVKLLIDRGVDFAKPYDGLNREAYFGIAEEAKKQGLTIAGHVPVALKASEVSNAGQKSIEHCCEGNMFEECSSREEELRKKIVERMYSDNPKNMNELVIEIVRSYDEAKCRELINTFLKNNTWFVPTLLVGGTDRQIRKNWRNDERVKYMPKGEIDWWSRNEKNTQELYGKSYPEINDMRYKLVNDMNKAGVNLLAGSDTPIYGIFFGSSLHEELVLLVEAGLTELEALQAATVNPVKYLEQTELLGTVEQGKLADLLILNANPLEDIENTTKIYAVISNGNLYDRNKLDQILLNVEKKAKEEDN